MKKHDDRCSLGACVFVSGLILILRSSNDDDARARPVEQTLYSPLVAVFSSCSCSHIAIKGIYALLITPIQRVPRYVLLLKELIKHTPATHPDHADLKKALSVIEGALTLQFL